MATSNERVAIDRDALRAATEERLAQSERLFNTTRDAGAWQDYLRAVRYFEDVLALINESETVPHFDRLPIPDDGYMGHRG